MRCIIDIVHTHTKNILASFAKFPKIGEGSECYILVVLSQCIGIYLVKCIIQKRTLLKYYSQSERKCHIAFRNWNVL